MSNLEKRLVGVIQTILLVSIGVMCLYRALKMKQIKEGAVATASTPRTPPTGGRS